MTLQDADLEVQTTFFTTFNDDKYFLQMIEGSSTTNDLSVCQFVPEDYDRSISQSEDAAHTPTLVTHPRDITINDSASKVTHGEKRFSTAQLQTRIGKSTRKDRPRMDSPVPGYMCFSMTGRPIKIPHRSQFSDARRQEVLNMREKRACLRCSILKRPCSGEDPCKTCVTLSAAAKAMESRVLMWMECIRPSIRDFDVFQQASSTVKDDAISALSVDLLRSSTSVELAVTSMHSSAMLTCPDSVLISCVANFLLLCPEAKYLLSPRECLQFWRSTLDENLAKHAWLLIVLMARFHDGYDWSKDERYTPDDIRILRNSTGHKMVSTLERLLKPPQLETTKRDSWKAKAMCHMILAVLLTLKISQPSIINTNAAAAHSSDAQSEALCRLLCHYFAYLYQDISKTPAQQILRNSLQTFTDNSEDVPGNFHSRLGFSIVPISQEA